MNPEPTLSESDTSNPTSPRPDPEVPATARRRRFTAAYKLRILEEAERIKREGGSIGALLRREKLYTSHLSEWRRAREQGAFDALAKKRGRKPDPDAALRRELEALRRQNAQLQQRLEKAELVIDVQKKLSRLLGMQPDEQAS